MQSPIAPPAVVFVDAVGTANDTYTIPAMAGVDYLVGGKVVPAGTYPGTGTVTVTAKAQTDYGLAPGAPASWTVTFKDSLAGAAPRITGIAKVGYTLTANPGIWSPAPVTLRYQWYRAGIAIVGATAATYRPTNTDAGATLTVRVIASKTGYTTVGKPSAATAAVAKDSLAGAAPRITGTAKVGYTLTANPGIWSPAPVTLRYQWYRAGIAIVGATAATYRPTNTDAGATLTVRVIASKTGYTTVGKPSAATAAVAKDSLAGATPRITGTAKVGYTLTANPGTWSPSPVTLRYQWYRAGIAIVGATAATYRPTNADAGATLTVRVIASKTGYTTVGKSSAATAAVAKGSLAGAAPWITGVFEVGYTLTTGVDPWSPSPVTLRYQWYRSKVAVVGATNATYTLTAADAGATITVKVIASRTGYTTAGATSPATSKIASGYVPPAPAPYEPPAPAPYEPPAPVAYYANCDAVRAAGAAPLYASQPGYRGALDRDRDGIACE
ncbi:excalibur calcium-binding domain-containing protein [Pseudarthrobacter sp. H2]|uniref:excalibur calcium-binding domain-containing protein n=1 Tax=Pseudarthrobacter sp. H2 TaxID=3418415 RepID=UPI003CECC3DA